MAAERMLLRLPSAIAALTGRCSDGSAALDEN